MRILKRLLDFIASRMLLITVVCALLVISFYLAMNTANIWVLIDDGLDARAGVVLMGGSESELTSYFKAEFLAQDPVLQVGLSDTSPYKDYEIRGYDHRVKMISVWSWPWENVARAEVVESIPAIDGTIRSSKREAALARRRRSAAFSAGMDDDALPRNACAHGGKMAHLQFTGYLKVRKREV